MKSYLSNKKKQLFSFHKHCVRETFLKPKSYKKNEGYEELKTDGLFTIVWLGIRTCQRQNYIGRTEETFKQDCLKLSKTRFLYTGSITGGSS